MNEYWNEVWSNPNIKEYIGYAKNYATRKPEFLEIFKLHDIKSVCDAACGFGAYGVMLAKNGYEVSGFDISANSIHLTQRIMKELNCSFVEYKVCDITGIEYNDASFCAAVAHAVIDHISFAAAKTALNELYRILRSGGLLYLSFDPLSEEDVSKKHELLEDGSRVYEDGLLFRHYTDDDIHILLNGRNVIYKHTNPRGDREYVLQKQ